MTNSDQIKEAPTPARSQQIFRNFTDATVALLDSPDTPATLREMLFEAIHEAGNLLEAHNTPDCPEEIPTRYTLSRIFDLADTDADDGRVASDIGALRAHAERLIDEIFDAAEPNDEQARALLFIIQRLAFDDDCDLAEALRKELFYRCPAGDQMVSDFANHSKSGYLKTAA